MLNKSKSNYQAGCLLLWKTEAPVSRSQGIEEASEHQGPSEALVHFSSRSLILSMRPHPDLLTSSDQELPITQAPPPIIGSLHI